MATVKLKSSNDQKTVIAAANLIKTDSFDIIMPVQCFLEHLEHFYFLEWIKL